MKRGLPVLIAVLAAIAPREGAAAAPDDASATVSGPQSLDAGASAEARASPSSSDEAPVAPVVVPAEARLLTAPPGPAASTGHPVRAGLEVLATLAAGTLWYVIDDRNILDWDSPSLRARLTGEAWTFDNNTLEMNYVRHPLSGAGWYALARGNDLGPLASAGYALGGSFLWEYVIEFKEKISINDVVVTPLAGIAFGGFLDKLALYVNTTPGPPSAGRQALQWILGPTVKAHDVLDGRVRRGAGAGDALGSSSGIWHRFSARYRLQAARLVGGGAELEGVHGAGVSGKLVSLPGYAQPGELGRWFGSAEISSLELLAEGSGEGAGMDLRGETTVAGYLRQRVGQGGEGRSEGSILEVGAPLAFRYRDTRVAGPAQRLGILHAPGVGVDWRLWRGRIGATLGARASIDFAGIGATSHAAWTRAHPGLREKSILRKQGYYYGWGGSARLGSELTLGPVTLGGRVGYGEYDSIEGRDRTQEKVTADVQLSDGILEYGLDASVAVWRGVAVGAHWERQRWSSRTGDVTGRFEVQRLGGQLSLEW